MKRTLASAAALLAIYVGLSFLNDPRGFLGTDTGGKVATLEVMDREARLDPDVGYWAEQWDPDGLLHPLYNTSEIDGKWVQVTTLPALYAALPLYQLGGYRLALLLPMLGSVLAALAGLALARRLGADDRTAWGAFWLIGVASPITVYALDFWEHSLGVACIAWGLALLIDASVARRWVRAAGAGVLFGVAATMRTEALVYGAVLTAATCLVILLAKRDRINAVITGLLVAAGLAIVMLANYGLEKATVGGTLRSSRAAIAVDGATAATAATGRSVSRLEEAALTTLGLHPRLEASAYLLGAVLLALLLFAALRGRSADPGPARIAVLGAAALYLVRAADGLGFVPGLVAAAPLAVVGAALGWNGGRWERRIPMAALVALPVVWRFQFTGGAAPQWAGRYVLPTTVVLVALGASRLSDIDRWVRRGLVSLAVCVTAFGVAWLSVRSHDVGGAGEALAARPEPVLVSRVAHLFREEGHWYGDKRWLTVPTSAEEPLLEPVLESAGVDRFGWVDLDLEDATPPAVTGYRAGASSTVPFLSGVRLRVTEYVRAR